MAKDKSTGLTDKQEKFCQEYLIDLNGTQAAIRAGYSEDTAQEIASQNLSKLIIQNRVSELKKGLSEKTGITQEWVLNRFKEISDRCVQAVPVMRFDSVSKQMVQATEEDPETGEMVGLWTFDSSGANKATEMLGKHLGFFETDNKQKVPDSNIVSINIVKPIDD